MCRDRVPICVHIPKYIETERHTHRKKQERQRQTHRQRYTYKYKERETGIDFGSFLCSVMYNVIVKRN